MLSRTDPQHRKARRVVLDALTESSARVISAVTAAEIMVGPIARGDDAATSARRFIEGLRADFPGLEGAGRFAIAVNSEYADEGRLLVDGDEVALIPPVSGGRGPTPPARRGSPP